MKHLGDITKINGAEIEPVDVITGGSPCQDLSTAGKRAGLAGARSGLFMEQIRIVKEMREHERRMGRTGEFVRPRYMVWENVPGAFSSNGGRDFAAVLEEIIRIAEPEAPDIEVPEKGWPTWGGYHDEVGGRWSVAWRVHDAQHWGVPQRRRRISIVADFGGDTAGEISFERKSVRGDITEGGTARKEIAGDTGAGADCTGKDIICMATQQGGAELRSDDRAPTLTAAAGMSGNNQPVICLQGNGIDRADTAGCNGKGWREDVSYTLNTIDRPAVMCAGFKLGNSEQARSIGYAEEQAPTLNAECGGNKPAVMAFDTTQITSPENRSRTEFGNPCHTLNASAHTPCIAFDMTHACDVIRECGEHAPSLTARAGTGGNQVPLTYQAVTGTLSPGAHAGSYNGQDAYNDMLVVSNEISPALRARANDPNREDMAAYVAENMVVRRLTPLECERLQGYPDGWTDIGEWRDSKGKLHKDADSPRYKACGNSIALPFWQFLAKRISAQYIRPITMGSLFDGISGFCLCFAKWNGANSCKWASEIEEFPIAVAKKHFGDEETGEAGDFERIL
nr:MAG TPA: Cytosine specific methyltransferase [Caudoviricetes sp.]